MKKIILGLFILLIPTSGFSQNKNIMKELALTQFNTATTIYCGITKDFNNSFPKEDLKFTGYIDQEHMLKLFISQNSEYVLIVENLNKLSCIHYGGQYGQIEDHSNKNINPINLGVK